MRGTVYPRSRGEYVLNGMTAVGYGGLSPLARGIHVAGLRGTRFDRFIPARAGNTRLPAIGPRSMTVYPRSRGEHKHIAFNIVRQLGLSPLARGTRVLPPYRVRYHRFIPARAGNTIEKGIRIVNTAVYPRSRGEHRRPGLIAAYSYGLSPLARGTPTYNSRNIELARFIPARAGNTLKLYTCIYYTFSCNNISPTFGSQSRIVKERITY